MKTTPVFSFLVWLTFAVTGHAQSPTPLQMATKLEHGLREEGNQAKDQWTSPEWKGRFSELHAAARGLDITAATVIVRQVEVSDLPDATRTLCHELLDEIRKERSARNDTLAHRVDAAIKKASETCRNSKDESALNPIQHELASLQDELKREPREPKMEGLETRLSWTAEAVSTWQDVLALRSKGYEKEATERGATATPFVKGENDFDGPRNVRAVMSPDGSLDVTWENLPGSEGDIPIQDFDAEGHYVTIAVAPAGSTSFHIPRDYKLPPPKPHPQTPPSDPAARKASGAAAENTPEGNDRKAVD